MASDEKRTECVKTYVGERLMLDLSRRAAREDRSLSDVVWRILRDHLYGTVDRTVDDRRDE
jgi:hypothetical protein